MAVRRAWTRRCAAGVVTLALQALGGCGGGISIGFGDGFDNPPSVSLATSVDSARPGDPIHLAAAASDDFGVDFVIFYRVELDGTATRLGSDPAVPFQWDTVMPSTSAVSVQFYARAVDGAGQASDSALVTVAVLR